MRVTLVLLALSAGTAFAQALPKPVSGPTFEVVSIRRNTSNALWSDGSSQRPDGGFALLNVPIMTLIGSSQIPPIAPVDMVGLPEWAQRERYDVSATSPLSRSATAGERAAMLRAMLADRFKLVTHVEKRESPAYDLVFARSDGRLGPAIKPSATDCASKAAADRAAADAALAAGTRPSRPPSDLSAPPPTCGPIRIGDGVEGDMTMENFAFTLRGIAGRPIVDKTTLKGSYRIKVQFDVNAAVTGPDTAPSSGGLPSLFSALPDQLGLKLESSKAQRDVLVIDRLERPTQN